MTPTQEICTEPSVHTWWWRPLNSADSSVPRPQMPVATEMFPGLRSGTREARVVDMIVHDKIAMG